LIAITGCLVFASLETMWLLPAMFAHGIALIFLFAPLHEAIHRTAFRSRGLNDAFGFVAGLLLLLPREYFRAFHFAHHRFTQDPATDPELATPKPATPARLIWHVTGIPMWIALFRGLLARAAGRLAEPFYATDRVRQAVITESRLALAIYLAALIGSIATGSTLLLWFWIVPVLLGQPMLRLYLLAEHGGCPRNPDMLENTRTTYTNALMRVLVWNGSFHAEHHAWPSIPFHALPRANTIVHDRLKTTAPGYRAVLSEVWSAVRQGRTL
jgi:fatty acid desaturase